MRRPDATTVGLLACLAPFVVIAAMGVWMLSTL